MCQESAFNEDHSNVKNSYWHWTSISSSIKCDEVKNTPNKVSMIKYCSLSVYISKYFEEIDKPQNWFNKFEEKITETVLGSAYTFTFWTFGVLDYKWLSSQRGFKIGYRYVVTLQRNFWQNIEKVVRPVSSLKSTERNGKIILIKDG